MGTTRRTIGIALVLAAAASCRFDLPRVGSDGGLDAVIVPDPIMCASTSAMCVTDMVLRACTQVGQLPVDTPCAWGCLGQAAPVHCGQIQPTGTVVTAADLMPDPALLDITRALAAGTIGVINTDDGSITNVRTAGTGVRSGIDFQVRIFDAGAAGTRSAGVFRFGKLALTGDWVVRGSRALAIVSLGDAVLQGRFDLKGDCAGTNAGPGGFPGGALGANAAGLGGGTAGAPIGGDSTGGGGGGHGATGGDGGKPLSVQSRPAGGTIFGDEKISLLLGGGGGGGGGNGGDGGGGGGAIHIAANGKVTLRAAAGLTPSGINAGGCGGERDSQSSGGGGGAGGAILIEATDLELDGAHLAVNGGGGGAAGGAGGTGDGGDGALGPSPAPGGIGTANGGNGGAANSRPGGRGTDGTDSGGGGGGVGRIRVHTRTLTGVTVKNGALVSPTFEETGSTSTKGLAIVQ